MKLSIFTTVTDPSKRGDNVKDALACYKDLADEVVVVNGSITPLYAEGIKEITHLWRREFDWAFIGEQFTRGYNASSGDWVIHADLDFVFHENDFNNIRKALEDNPEAPAVSFYKWQFILPDRYNLKSRLAIAVNKKKYGDRIKFSGGGDLCQPTLDGKDLDINELPQAGVPFYNYEKILKTEDQIKDDVQRMARAWDKHFGNLHLGDDDTAYSEWLKMVTGRFGKPQRHISLSDHPKYVQDTIKNLKPEHFGYNGFNKLEANDYVKSSVRSR